jgi:tRNA nucleotidyltransferase (CCA-adding enzyme)
MSDYMFKLENHLSTAQNNVVAELRNVAADLGAKVFLTGGAVRDMFGGFAIRDLDFTIEGDALKVAKTVAQRIGAEILHTDTTRKKVDLLSPDGVTFEISMARQERYAKTGAKPQVTPSTVYEDLARRDFTVNSLGLSLNRASRGLLIDPTNGMGDLDRRELRACSNTAFYDSPVRLMRLVRYRVRLGFMVVERTVNQAANAREAGVEKYISREESMAELRAAAREPNVADLLEAWQKEGYLGLVSPALASASLNTQSFVKLQKFRESLPFGIEFQADDAAVFFWLLTEKLTPKERASIAELDAENSAAWMRLPARAAKLEKEIAAQNLHKPSKVWAVLRNTHGEQILYLILRSQQRVVQDRIRNYLYKYVPSAQEITDLQVIEAGYTVGTAKFEKAKADMIAKRLDMRPKKEPEPEVAL